MVSRGPRPQHRKAAAGRPWDRIRKRVIDSSNICWICGGKVRRDLPPKHPLAPTADHIIELKQGGRAQDRNNLRVAHYGCNSRRGAKLARHRERRMSWEW